MPWRTFEYDLVEHVRSLRPRNVEPGFDLSDTAIAFLVAHGIRIVRIHTGGEFYSAGYARKWLWVARRSRRVRP